MKSYFSTNRVLAWTIAAVAIATIFFACKKEVTTDTAGANENDNNTLLVASHETQINAIYGDMFTSMAIIAKSQGQVNTGRQASFTEDYANQLACPSVIISSTDVNVWPKRISVDYGDACKDNFGVTRSGKLIIYMSGRLFTPNARIGIHTENYKYNGIPVSGKDSIYDITLDLTSGVQYTTEITGGKVSYGDSLIVGYNSKKTVKQVQGIGSPTPDDDTYNITGSASLSYEKGGPAGSATIATLSPLLKAAACAWISQGQLKVEFNSISAVIDYGNGVCDNKATIVVNSDKVKEISLK
ncbi:hypothetical protein ECE50_019090 [Chitinophaga sp. Mgbs1]|uniref:Uncharacterized protein n=1 Tax=Chitinophaga solisilvae TaxID=1233460 RepID=A0A3S1DMV2_9BACT|nr:hypothetical protein [Chitinophaga solisilvae]